MGVVVQRLFLLAQVYPPRQHSLRRSQQYRDWASPTYIDFYWYFWYGTVWMVRHGCNALAIDQGSDEGRGDGISLNIPSLSTPDAVSGVGIWWPRG